MTAKTDFYVGHGRDPHGSDLCTGAATWTTWWTDPDGGPPRFSMRVVIADDERHSSDPSSQIAAPESYSPPADPSHRQELKIMPNVDQPDNDTAPQPMSAAEHCATAGDHFARAQEIYIEADLLAPDQRTQEYQQHMEWAWMHLRFAEVVTQGLSAACRASTSIGQPSRQTTDHAPWPRGGRVERLHRGPTGYPRWQPYHMRPHERDLDLEPNCPDCHARIGATHSNGCDESGPQAAGDVSATRRTAPATPTCGAGYGLVTRSAASSAG
jgi:hypothetical protein